MREHVFVHPRSTVVRFLALSESGLGARRIARELDIPLSTVRDWSAGKLPRTAHLDRCEQCGNRCHDFLALPTTYPYLLGLYLGDGCISVHRRGVFKLRIILDVAYPGIVEAAATAIKDVLGVDAGQWTTPDNCVEVYGYSKSWPCLFPQCGPGKKHERAIELTHWQIDIVQQHPELFLRGLIHSDGCRFENTGRGGWRASRYAFYNLSDDIIALFCWACELLELHWTESKNTIYVSRKADVARMDEFIGSKR